MTKTMTARTAIALGLLMAGTALSAEAQTATSGPAKAPIEVPLRYEAGRMLVPVTAPDGTELAFLVSVGTAVTVLTESTANRFAGQALTLGGAPLNMENSQTLPDDRLVFQGVRADGMVGNNTLNNFDNLFDVPGGRLVLKPFGRSVEWAGTTLSDPIRLRVLHGVVISMDVEVNGQPYPAMLELGAPALLVNQAVLDETGIEGKTVDSFRVGTSTFHDVPVQFSDHPVIARFSPNGAGFVLVGAPIAKGCAISVSWVHQEMRTCVR